MQPPLKQGEKVLFSLACGPDYRLDAHESNNKYQAVKIKRADASAPQMTLPKAGAS